MAQVKILPEPRRSCEECLAIRAPFSQPRKLPKPALVLPPNPATVLRQLLIQLDSPRPVYRRLAEEALASDEPLRIAEAIRTLRAEIALCQQSKEKLAATYPLLYA
jgi:hypothetical protein